MSSLKSRFEFLALARPDITQADLARATGAKPPSVNAWFSGGTRSMKAETAAKAAALYGCNPMWLATGAGNKWLMPLPSQSYVDSNTEVGPVIKGKGRYPVVSSVQAGDWTELCDHFLPGDADDWGFSPHDLGSCGYMLRVIGPSMTNTESGARYSFPEGMLLHINPDLDPVPGKFVVVRREAEKEATFKRLAMVDGELYLEAINPDWPHRYLKLHPGDVFCGVVVDASFGKLP